jgi:hypothetical protein
MVTLTIAMRSTAEPRYYWKRTALNAKECVVRVLRVLRVPISAGVHYYVRILSKHVAARSYEDLRRDPTNPLLIHESPSWRAVSEDCLWRRQRPVR